MARSKTIESAISLYSKKQVKYYLSISKKEERIDFWEKVLDELIDKVLLVATARVSYDARGKNHPIEFEITFAKNVNENNIDEEEEIMKSQIQNALDDYFNVELSEIANSVLGFETSLTGQEELIAEVRGKRSTELENMIRNARQRRGTTTSERDLIKDAQKNIKDFLKD